MMGHAMVVVPSLLGESSIMIGFVLVVGGVEAIAWVWMWAFGERCPFWSSAVHVLRHGLDVRPVIGFWAQRSAGRRRSR
jgi:hypothetical protein